MESLGRTFLPRLSDQVLSISEQDHLFAGHLVAVYHQSVDIGSSGERPTTYQHLAIAFALQVEGL